MASRTRKKSSHVRRTNKASRKRTARGDNAPPEFRAEHPAWRGHLRLSLVTCPVALYTATSHAKDISFHLLNPETNNRIRMIPTDPETGPVERADLVKGYETSKDHYVILDNDDLEQVKLETTQALDIERFVDVDDIDRLYWNDPYFLLPDGDMGNEAYAVIRDAMAKSGRIALGRVTMHTRERLMALEPRDRGIIAYTLRMQNEVIDPAAAFADIANIRPDREMISIAQKIVDQKEGPFNPANFKDRYEDALRDLIRRKKKGQKPAVAPPPEDTNVIDLMEVLKKSAKAKGAASKRAAPKRGKKKRARKRA